MKTDTRNRQVEPAPGPVAEPVRLRDEQIRLQNAVIEMLHAQLEEQRGRNQQQTAEIVELRRLLKLRDDLLAVRATPAAGTVKGTLFEWVRRLARVLVGRS